ncbi:MAG: putative secreted protein [Myxococcales bacterium]|nr:putative secreted protein [Myxococcales bacterium]
MPGAILIGSIVIAAAIYVGLRRPTSTPATPSPAIAAADVEGQVRDALEAQRLRFVSDCWTPSAAKVGEPVRSPYSFNVTIAADGHEISRGIIELRGQSRSDVARCLRAIVDAPLQIRAPGQNTTVTVAIWLPQ